MLDIKIIKEKLLDPSSSVRYNSLSLLEQISDTDILPLILDVLPHYGDRHGFPGEILQELALYFPIATIETAVGRSWSVLPEVAKINIAATLATIKCSDDFLVAISKQPTSTNVVRRLIASGYFMAMKYGRSPLILWELLDLANETAGPADREKFENLKEVIQKDYPR